MSIFCTVQGIIGRFKETTGKEHHEWVKILTSKPHRDRLAAYEFMVEQGMAFHQINFLLWTAHDHIKYTSKEHRPLPTDEGHHKFLAKVVNDSKNKNVLYEKETLNSTFKIEIFYEDGNLIISRWVLNDRYEDERSIAIDKKDLPKLREILCPDMPNLNDALKARFSGDTAYENIKQFLEQEKISYSSRLY